MTNPIQPDNRELIRTHLQKLQTCSNDSKKLRTRLLKKYFFDGDDQDKNEFLLEAFNALESINNLTPLQNHCEEKRLPYHLMTISEEQVIDDSFLEKRKDSTLPVLIKKGNEIYISNHSENKYSLDKLDENAFEGLVFPETGQADHLRRGSITEKMREAIRKTGCCVPHTSCRHFDTPQALLATLTKIDATSDNELNNIYNTKNRMGSSLSSLMPEEQNGLKKSEKLIYDALIAYVEYQAIKNYDRVYSEVNNELYNHKSNSTYQQIGRQFNKELSNLPISVISLDIACKALQIAMNNPENDSSKQAILESLNQAKKDALQEDANIQTITLQVTFKTLETTINSPKNYLLAKEGQEILNHAKATVLQDKVPEKDLPLFTLSIRQTTNVIMDPSLDNISKLNNTNQKIKGLNREWGKIMGGAFGCFIGTALCVAALGTLIFTLGAGAPLAVLLGIAGASFIGGSGGAALAAKTGLFAHQASKGTVYLANEHFIQQAQRGTAPDIHSTRRA